PTPPQPDSLSTAVLPHFTTGQGLPALKSSLHTSHLRLVHQLLTGQTTRTNPPDPGSTSLAAGGVKAGVLATLTLDQAGEVVTRVGEEQVPGSWLRAGFLVRGLSEMVGQKLGLGNPRGVVLEGAQISARVSHREGETKVTFVDPKELRTSKAMTADSGEVKPSSSVAKGPAAAEAS
ncbi:MAG: hypothetical protein AAGA56_23650, partial [Myxococcota bacterium]